MYAAKTFQSAALESVFHDVEHVSSPTYLKSRFASWHYSGLAPSRDLTVFELVNPSLRQLSVPGRKTSLHEHELVHTPSGEYPNTRTWARFLHASWPALDGLAWRPRLGGNGLAFVFFGDRCGTAFRVVSGPVAATSRGGLSNLGRVAARASIRLI